MDNTDLPPAFSILFLLATYFAPAGNAHATAAVRVLETWPPGNNIVLGHNQNFYLRLAYDTDLPVGIWTAPFFRGERVKVGSNPSQTYSGKGETYGWFFFMEPGDQVDEIRITAGDGGTSGTPVVAIWRGHVIAGRAPDNTQVQPAWITEMRARATAAQDAAYRAQMNKPVSVTDMALFNVFMLAMLALGVLGIAAPAMGIRRWHGGWRIAAAVPAAIMIFVVLRIIFDVARDATSHNLWPFEILMYGASSTVWIAVLWVARRISGAGR